MINKISNLEELYAERERLQKKRHELELAMSNDFNLIKESLQPRNLIRNGLKGITANDIFSGNNLIETSLITGINFLVSKVLFRRSSIIKKLIFSWLIRRYGVDFFEKNAGTILRTIKDLVSKFKNREGKKDLSDIFDSGTVADDY